MFQVLGLLVAFATAFGVLYVLRRPRWAVLLILVMFPLEQLLQSYIPLFNTNRSLFNILIGFMACFAVVSRMFQRESVNSGVWNPVIVFSLVIVGLCWVGLLWTPSRMQALGMVRSSFPYVVLMMLLTPMLLDDLADFRRLAYGLMIVGTVIATLIIMNPRSSFYGGRMTLDLGSYAGAERGRANPLALASLGGAMALTAALIRVERVTPLLNLIRLSALTLGLGLAITSGSRGQVLAAGLVGVLFFPVARQVADPKQFFVTAGGLGFLGGLLMLVFTLFVGHENRERWDLGQMAGDTTERFNMSLDLTLAWIQSPAHWIQGLGTNAFTTLTPYGETPYVHNIVVEGFAELGLVGGAALSIVIVGTFRYGIRLWRRYREDPVLRSLAAILLAMSTFNLLLTLKQGSLAAHPYNLMWWLILARIGAHEERMAAAAPAYDELDGYDPDEDPAAPDDPDASREYDGYDGYDDEGYEHEYDDYALHS